jgi:hypothetical protein
MLNTSLPLSHLALIINGLRRRFAALNTYYEAGWTDSWCHRRCHHAHDALIDAAKCAAKQGMPRWYVFTVEFDSPRQLTGTEEMLVNEFRFGPTPTGENRKPGCDTQQPGLPF